MSDSRGPIRRIIRFAAVSVALSALGRVLNSVKDKNGKTRVDITMDKWPTVPTKPDSH